MLTRFSCHLSLLASVCLLCILLLHGLELHDVSPQRRTGQLASSWVRQATGLPFVCSDGASELLQLHNTSMQGETADNLVEVISAKHAAKTWDMRQI